MKENQVSRSESWDGKLSLSGNFWNGKHFKTHLVIRPQNLDDRCDNRRFLLSAQDFLASTPTHKNLKVEYKLLCCVCLKHRLKIQTEKLDTNWKIRQDQKIRLRVLSRRLKIKEARERGRVVVRYAYSYDSVKRVFLILPIPNPVIFDTLSHVRHTRRRETAKTQHILWWKGRRPRARLFESSQQGHRQSTCLEEKNRVPLYPWIHVSLLKRKNCSPYCRSMKK